jgi:hypothetical protein
MEDILIQNMTREKRKQSIYERIKYLEYYYYFLPRASISSNISIIITKI